MENNLFDIKDTVYNVTEKYNEAIEVLISLGFDNLKNEVMRKSLGKAITIEAALKMKKIDPSTFETELLNKIQERKEQGEKLQKEVISLAGVLPCPVKVPLMETFEKWLGEQDFSFELKHEFKAASMGIDWMMESLEQQSIHEIPDFFLSAGFELFFDQKLFGKWKAEDLFVDVAGLEHYHQDFENDKISLKDPKKQYSILGVVPAVFLINTEELNGRRMPTSWSDILSKEFENSVSLPIADFDLFNAILLNIYKNYGEDGVIRLGKSLSRGMHPSEMVKSHIKKNNRPAISIMPYFFSWMAKVDGPMKAVWPEDGAIISPIFMLSKKEKKEKLAPIVQFFASKEVGEILAHNGRMPSVNPEVDNQIEKENNYMWLGWDFIKEHDISTLIKTCIELFESGSKGE